LPPIPYRDWVIIVGATNRPDVLDPALTRPGRLDRVIHVHMPDRQDRLAMIRGYLSRIRHNLTEDHIERLADLTAGVSPAHIASLITKDAVRYAVVRGRECVEWQDFMRALDEARYGLADPIRQMDEKQRWAIAVHEAGHAVFAFRLLPDERIVKASILRRTGLAQALGFVDHRPEDETYALPFRKMAAWILVAMAGDAAVRVLLGEPWSGASSDYEHVRSMVRYMAKSQLFGPVGLNGPELTEPEMNYIENAFEQAMRLAQQWEEDIRRVAQALLERQELSHDDIAELLSK